MFPVPKKVVLKNGLNALIRPLKGTDKKQLLRFYDEISDKTKHQLFQSCKTFEAWRTVAVKSSYLYTDGLDIDFKKKYSVIAVVEDEGTTKIIGDGRFFIDPVGWRSEIYLVTHELYRNIGVGSALMDYMLEALTNLKVKEVYCYISPDNIHMLRLIDKYNFNKESQDGFYLFWRRL